MKRPKVKRDWGLVVMHACALSIPAALLALVWIAVLLGQIAHNTARTLEVRIYTAPKGKAAKVERPRPLLPVPDYVLTVPKTWSVALGRKH